MTVGFFPKSSDAVISDCGRYRYTLSRWWDTSKPSLIFCMLNPSTADATQDDPTIRRCISFAKREDRGGIAIINLFAFRATDPDELRMQDDPFGPDNEQWIRHVIDGATANQEPIVCAWGRNAPQSAKGRTLLLQSHVELLCLGTTASGEPRHPLYIPSTQPLEHWR